MILNPHPGEKLDEVAKRLANAAEKAKGRETVTTTFEGVELTAKLGDTIDSITAQYNSKFPE